jgi:hypothetical protein
VRIGQRGMGGCSPSVMAAWWRRAAVRRRRGASTASIKPGIGFTRRRRTYLGDGYRLRWYECGSARLHSGLAWLAFAVASLLGHLRVVGKKEHALEKAEVHGAVLATVSRHADEHR